MPILSKSSPPPADDCTSSNATAASASNCARHWRWAGWTPSAGLVAWRAATALPIMMMLQAARRRLCYTNEEFATHTVMTWSLAWRRTWTVLSSVAWARRRQ